MTTLKGDQQEIVRVLYELCKKSGKSLGQQWYGHQLGLARALLRPRYWRDIPPELRVTKDDIIGCVRACYAQGASVWSLGALQKGILDAYKANPDNFRPPDWLLGPMRKRAEQAWTLLDETIRHTSGYVEFQDPLIGRALAKADLRQRDIREATFMPTIRKQFIEAYVEVSVADRKE